MKRQAPRPRVVGTSLMKRALIKLSSNGIGTNESNESNEWDEWDEWNQKDDERLPFSDSSGASMTKYNNMGPVLNSALKDFFPPDIINMITLYGNMQLYYKVNIEPGIDLHSIPLYMAPVVVRGEMDSVPTLGDGRVGTPLLTKVARLRGCWKPSLALLDFFTSIGPFPVESRVFQSATNEDMQIRRFRVGETIELTTNSHGPMFSCPLSAMWHWEVGAGREKEYKSGTSKRAYNNYHRPLPSRKLLVHGMRSNQHGVRLDHTPYDTMFVHEFTESPTDMKPSHMYNTGVNGFYEAFRHGVGQINSDHTYSCVVKWVGIIDACFAGTVDCPLTSFGSTDYFRLVVLTSSVKKS
jgi:hypothetical protein